MIPPAERGDRINADYVNHIIDQANRGDRLTISGHTRTHGPGGDTFQRSPIRNNFFDPAHMVTVVNSGTETINALTPAHIYTSYDKNAPPYSMIMVNQRILEVRAYPTTMHRRNHGVIVFDQIQPGETGTAYIDGLCLARITASSRRFLTFAGWKILWEENTAEVASNEDHYGIVQYVGDQGFWALLTAASSVATNRWKYSWTEKEWTMTASVISYETPTLPRVGPFTDETVGSTGYAWNSTEMENTATLAGSGWEDQSLALAADTITVGAINQVGVGNAGSTKYPVVWMEPLRLIDTGQIAYLFTGWNTPSLSI